MANKINIVISAQDKASTEIKKTAGEIQGLSSSADSASSATNRLGAAAGVAKTGLVAAGVAAVAAGTFAVKSAGAYEQSLNIFRSVSGATAVQMEQVAARSRELGRDISLPGVSASDAALAMVELAKAGLSVNDTLAASKGVLSLAKAGNLETAQAAEIAANALNSFGLKGSEATRVADLLAAGANASSADVTDLAYSLQMSSASAAAVKVPVDNLVAAIGLMANNGIKGSDAGTSLKSMFMNLIPTTDKAKESFKALNLDFYDAKGNFVGMREMIRQLQVGTKNLTDEQKAQHIETIFGADSSRAANILLKEGVDGYDAMTKAVNRNGAATELAAAQNAGFKGALDSLKSSLETVAIDVGMKLLPMLTDFANSVNGRIEPAFGALKSSAKVAIPVITALAVQVGNYLFPKLVSLWSAIEGGLVPALRNAWRTVSPLATIVGGAAVVAFGALLDLLTGTVRVLSALAPVIVSGIAAWGAYRGTVLLANGVMMAQSALITLTGTRFLVLNSSIIAVRGAVTAATVAQVAWNTVMSLNPIGLLVGGVVAASFAISSMAQASGQATTAIERHKLAQDLLTQANRDAKLAQDALKDAVLGQEGAALRVEQAQRNYNSALQEYGPKSLEARQAAFDLKGAQNDLEKATAGVRDRTNEAREAQERRNKAAEAVKKTSEEVAGTVAGEAGAWKTLSTRINEAAEARSKGDFKSPVLNLTNNPLNKHALGSVYAAGGLTLVGENGPEVVNLPRGSQVTQAYRSRGELADGGGVVLNLNGPISFADRSDIDYFAKRINQAARLARSGMASTVGEAA